MSVNDDARTPVALLARPGQARERLHQALDAAGARVVLEEDPGALAADTLSAAAPRAVLVALEPAVEDALEALEPALEAPGLLVIFDEADLAARREGWEAQRWVRHLAAKLHGHDDVLPPGREHEPATGPEPDHTHMPQQADAGAGFDPPVVGSGALAGDVPRERPATPAPPPALPGWEVVGDVGMAPAVASEADAAMEPAEKMPPPLSGWEASATVGSPEIGTDVQAGEATPPPVPDFSRLELVELEAAPAVVTTAAAPLAAARPAGAVLVIAGIGGPDAVRKLLVALPRGFRHPVLVQLRLDGGRYDNLVKQMARISALPVLMAEPGQEVLGARVYVLPEGVGVAVDGGGLQFAQVPPGQETIDVLPPDQSAVLLLSGADPERVDAALALAGRGAQVGGQALEGCYDATAVKLLAAGGIELGAPAQLAERLAGRWG